MEIKYNLRDVRGIAALAKFLERSSAEEWLDGNLATFLKLSQAAELMRAQIKGAEQLIEEDSRLYDLIEIQNNAIYN